MRDVGITSSTHRLFQLQRFWKYLLAPRKKWKLTPFLRTMCGLFIFSFNSICVVRCLVDGCWRRSDSSSSSSCRPSSGFTRLVSLGEARLSEYASVYLPQCISVTDGVSVVRTVPALTCQEPAWKALQGFVVFLIVVFLVLAPLTMLGVLSFNHRRGLLSQVKHRIRYGML
jgi:hypothetical protein